MCPVLRPRGASDIGLRCAFRHAAAESFFSSLERKVLSRHDFAAIAEAKEIVIEWCHDFYKNQRRHATIGMIPPAEFEAANIQNRAE